MSLGQKKLKRDPNQIGTAGIEGNGAAVKKALREFLEGGGEGAKGSEGK